MRFLIFLFAHFSCLGVAQIRIVSIDKELVLNGKNSICNKCLQDGFFSRFVKEDSTYIWDSFDSVMIHSQPERLKQVLEKIYYKAKSDIISSNLQSARLAIIMNEKEDPVDFLYFKLYEFCYSSKDANEIKNKMKDLALIKTLDWPDASIPVIFHLYKNHLYVFLNSSDDHEEPASQQRFERITNHIIQSITAEKK